MLTKYCFEQSSEECEGPFPWKTPLVSTAENGARWHSTARLSQNHGWVGRLPIPLQSHPCLRKLQEESASVGCISFDLPKPHAVAGQVLQHSVAVLERMFRKYEPLIFKIGFTHDPYFRWGNKLYGYAHAREKWAQMTILFITDEPYGPAMLEASLIDKFQSI